MIYLSGRRKQRHVTAAILLAIGLLGCSPLPRRGAGPEVPAVPAEPNAAAVRPEKIKLSLNFEPGTKTRYRVTTEAVTAMEGPESTDQDSASTGSFQKVSESSEVVFTREILGPLPGFPFRKKMAKWGPPEDVNTVVALITIDQVRYMCRSTGQPDLTFDSREPADQNSPFAKLIGQSYTIEIDPFGYVPGIFNLRPSRLAVRGPTPAHAAALDLVSPSTIFLRHGYFSLPGPDADSLTEGGRWRGVQQFTLKAPGTEMDRLGTHRFEKNYRLENVEQRPDGKMAMVFFEGSPIPKKTADSPTVEVPFLSCSYVGGGEFNLDAGRIESYLEHLEMRVPLPRTGAMPGENPEDSVVIAIRNSWVQRLDLD